MTLDKPSGWEDWIGTVKQGDCLKLMKQMPPGVVHCVVTSPPYYGLRDYGTAKWEGGRADCDHSKRTSSKTESSTLQSASTNWNHEREGWVGGICGKCGAKCIDPQLGLEKTPELYVSKMVEVFREVKRIMHPTGVLWLNMGDSYCGSWGDSGHRPERTGTPGHQRDKTTEWFKREGHAGAIKANLPGLKPKDLLEMPSRLVLALQADGWWLRCRIPWLKRNAMPESVQGSRWERHRIKIKKRTGGSCSGSMPPQSHHAGQVPHRDGSFSNLADNEWQDCPGCPKCTPNDGLVLRMSAGRPTQAVEYVFLLSKSKDYFYDNEAVKVDTEAVTDYIDNYETGDLFNTQNETLAQGESRTQQGASASVSGKRKGQGQSGGLSQDRKDEVDTQTVGGLPGGQGFSEKIQQERESQGGTEKILRKRKGTKDDRSLSFNGEGQRVSVEGSAQTSDTNADDQLRPDIRSMESDQKETELQVCHLRGAKTTHQGPHNSTHQGGATHHDKHSGAVSSLQCPEGKQVTSSRSLRNSDFFFQSWQGLWTDENGEPLAFIVNPKPYKRAHFATFPPGLVIPCLKAGTSERGACPECGSPWVRVVETTIIPRKSAGRSEPDAYQIKSTEAEQNQFGKGRYHEAQRIDKTLGWRPTCDCGKEPVSCLCFDPFMGVGTVAVVARKMGRSFCGFEINETYVKEFCGEQLQQQVFKLTH